MHPNLFKFCLVKISQTNLVFDLMRISIYICLKNIKILESIMFVLFIFLYEDSDNNHLYL